MLLKFKPTIALGGLLLAAVACDKFNYDTKQEDYEVSQYRTVLKSLEDKGIRFLPAKVKDGPAVLDEGHLEEKWSSDSIAQIEETSQQLERLADEADDLVQSKKGGYYEYRSRKGRDKGKLVTLTDMAAQSMKARQLLEQIQKTQQIVRKDEALKDWKIVEDSEKNLNAQGMLFNRVINTSTELRFSMDHNGGIFNAPAPFSQYQFSLYPAGPQIAEMQKETDQSLLLLLRVLKRYQSQQSQVTTMPSSKEIASFATALLYGNPPAEFEKPIREALAHVLGQTLENSDQILEGLRNHPVLRMPGRPTGWRPSEEILALYWAALQFESKYRLQEGNELDYQFLVLGGARRIRAKFFAIEANLSASVAVAPAN